MKRQYKTQGFTIDEKALSVISEDGTTRALRPKTCQLLIILLKNSGQVVTKQQLLDAVWASSVVDEQVIFQSIKEIRQLFQDHDVIKTLPKQGYIWLPNVKTSHVISSVIGPPYMKFVVILLIATAFSLSYFWLSSAPNTSFHSDIAGSVVILPTVNNIEGNDHSWVRLGMMDQVIQRLPNHDKFGILQTDYVLEVLARANVPLQNIKPHHVGDIFQVSGAELLVSTKLSGTPHDYQLSYTFYYRKAQTKGVLFSTDPQLLIDKLVKELNLALGVSDESNHGYYHSDFSDEMLGVAIDLRLENNHLAAKELLEVIVLKDPNNLTAQRLFIETLLNLQQLAEATQQLAIALPLAQQQQDHSELTRLLYFQAINLIQSNSPTEAYGVIARAFKLAESYHDWLFMAYLTDLKAYLATQAQQFSKAEAYYHRAMHYHRVLKCPVGESSTWVRLGLLAKQQNNVEKQTFAFEQAKSIATQRELHQQVELIEQIGFK